MRPNPTQIDRNDLERLLPIAFSDPGAELEGQRAEGLVILFELLAVVRCQQSPIPEGGEEHRILLRAVNAVGEVADEVHGQVPEVGSQGGAAQQQPRLALDPRQRQAHHVMLGQ